MDKEEVDARIAEMTKVEQAIGHPYVRHRVDTVVMTLLEIFSYLDEMGIMQESITLRAPIIGTEGFIDLFEIKRL